MARWSRLATVIVLLTAACHHATDSDDAEDGGDAAGPCVCAGVQGGGNGATVPCGTAACSDGTEYLCSEGSPIVIGTCGAGDEAADSGEPDADVGGGVGCLPNCDGTACGQPDGCGNVCTCGPGVTCNAGVCGNGCLESAGAVCLPGMGNASTCCQQGSECVTKDSGVSVCCALSTTASVPGGACQVSTDCCGYPDVQCSPSTQTCQ